VTRIKVHMLRRNRDVDTFLIDGSKPNFEWNNGVYFIGKSVNLATTRIKSELNTIPELVYLEDIPQPLQEFYDKHNFLGNEVLQNAVESVAEVGESIFSKLKMPSGKTMIIILFILMFVYAFISSGGQLV